jgi:UDP-glucose 4-epimerase
MRIDIVGAGGYIGRHLAEKLSAQNVEVSLISSSSENGINPITGILPERFEFASNTDAVIYLAQSPHYRNVPDKSPHLLCVNLVSAVRAAEAARKTGIKRFIYASTGNAYAPSFSPLHEQSPLRRDNWYSLSKVQAEEALALFRRDMEITIVRPFGIYGPGQTEKLVSNLMRRVLSGDEILIDQNPEDSTDVGGLRISLCYIHDAVEILYSLINKPEIEYLNLAGPEAVSIRTLVEMMGRISGKKVNIVLADKCRQFDLVADIELLKRVLNPKFTEIEAGLAQTVC